MVTLHIPADILKEAGLTESDALVEFACRLFDAGRLSKAAAARLCGLERLRCLHLNDSKNPFDSHKDRHELIAEGTLGAEPFKQIMKDKRFVGVIKVLETRSSRLCQVVIPQCLTLRNPAQTSIFRLSYPPMSFPHRGLAALLVLPLVVSPSRPIAAQVTWTGHLGATLTSTMVTDQVTASTIHLKPGLAPTLGIEASLPLKTKTPIDATFELVATTGTLQSHEGGNSIDLASMRTFALAAGISAHMIGPVRYRAAAGFISYLTSEKASIFQDGAPIRPAATLALEYRRRLTSVYMLSGLVRYDVHGFTTKQLQTSGYTGSQIVHRVTVGVGVSR